MQHGQKIHEIPKNLIKKIELLSEILEKRNEEIRLSAKK